MSQFKEIKTIHQIHLQKQKEIKSVARALLHT